MANIDWTSIIINVVISLILSISLFVLGLRAGKERIERLGLREKYRGLTVHFKEIYNSLENKQPRKWSDFPLRDLNSGIETVKDMIEKSNHLELNNKLIKDLKEVETEALRYGHILYYESTPLKDIVMNCLNDVGIEMVKETENIYSSKNKVSPNNINGGLRILTRNCFSLLLEENLEERIQYFNNEFEAYYIEFNIPLDYNKTISMKVYSTDLNIKNRSKFIESLNRSINAQFDLLDIQKERNRIMHRLSKLLIKLERKTKEPYSFWNTVSNAFRDLFR